MALVAVENQQNGLAIIILSNGIHLGYKYILQPLNGNVIAYPAIRGVYIMPGGNHLKLSKKPLALEVFSLEDNTRVEIFTRSGDGINQRNPCLTGIAFLEGFFRLCTSENKTINS